MYKKILVPLDGSELAEAILPHVEEIAQLTGAEILLVRVVTESEAVVVFSEAKLAVQLAQEREHDFERADQYLSGVKDELADRGFTVTTDVLAEEKAAKAIADYALMNHFDLIAMSTHGRGGLTRVVLGSVADDIVRSSHIPLLLVHPPDVA